MRETRDAQFLQKFTRFALIAVTSARPRVCKCPPTSDTCQSVAILMNRRHWHSNEKKAKITSMFFSSKGKKRDEHMLCCCFFLLVLGSPVRKTSGRLSRDCLEENQGVLWSTNVFGNSNFRTFPAISQNLPENVSIFCQKEWPICWLRKTKH